MAEWLRPLTSIPEVPGSNPGPAVAPLGKALYPYCPAFGGDFKLLSPVWRAYLPVPF